MKELTDLNQELEEDFKDFLRDYEPAKQSQDYKIFLENLFKIQQAIPYYGIDWFNIGSGHERSGKSTLVGDGVRVLAEVVFNKSSDYVIDKLYARTLKEFWLAMKRHKFKHYPIWADEAIEFLFNRESMKKASVLLVKMFVVNASWGGHYFLIIPNFYYLEKYVREWRARMLFYTFRDNTNYNNFMFAVFSRDSYYRLVFNREKYEPLLPQPYKFIAAAKPTFVGMHPLQLIKQQDKDFWDAYEQKKEELQDWRGEEIEQELQELDKILTRGKSLKVGEMLKVLVAYAYAKGSKAIDLTANDLAKLLISKNVNALEKLPDLLNYLEKKGYIVLLEEGKKYKLELTDLALAFVGITPSKLSKR